MKYPAASNFIILILILILIISVMSLTGLTDTYKEVDGTYIKNPTDGERVQFSGKYVARTSNYDENVLYEIPPAEYDIVEVDGESVFIIDENNNLSGNIGKTVHVKGVFEYSGDIRISDDVYMDGHFFKADEIRIND